MFWKNTFPDFDDFWSFLTSDPQWPSMSVELNWGWWQLGGKILCSNSVLNENFLLTGSFIFFLVTLLSFGHGMDEDMMQKPECQMWAKLENKTLPLQDQGHANCTTNSDCTGFACKGIYQVRTSPFVPKFSKFSLCFHSLNYQNSLRLEHFDFNPEMDANVSAKQ